MSIPKTEGERFRERNKGVRLINNLQKHSVATCEKGVVLRQRHYDRDICQDLPSVVMAGAITI